MEKGRCRLLPRGFAAAALSAFFLSSVPAWAEPVSYEVDKTASDFVVHVHRKGLLSPLLHDHYLIPTAWSARATFDPDNPQATSVTVVVSAGSLLDAQPELSAEDKRKVERQVAGPEVLNSAQYPEIRFKAERFEPSLRPNAEPGVVRGTLVGMLTLHGQTHTIRVPVAARHSPGELRVNGNTSVRQTEYGIKPYSTALGAIAVHDRVDITFSLAARAVGGGE